MINLSLCTCTDLELNGMGCSDKGETPPPLPLKGNTADYGNLLDNQELTSPTTPPPHPPHQRVGVLIRSERSSLMMHHMYNRSRFHHMRLTFGLTTSTVPHPCVTCANVPVFTFQRVHVFACLMCVPYFCYLCHTPV